jgi:murein DD-endopeptidase MepM/ murein hydrolase activator NlpD
MEMHRQIKFFLIFFIVAVVGCSKINKATDLLTRPSAKERYKRDLKVTDQLYKLWENQMQLALRDSVQVDLPYLGQGYFKPRNFPILSYDLKLKTGEKLDVIVEKDSAAALVFIDLYYQQNDSLKSFKRISGSEYQMNFLSEEIEQSGKYKIVIQPEIEASTPFSVKIKTSPVYGFPIAGGQNKNIQSLWGAARDGGRRSHEGVDIFAARGTPVVAVTEGKISSSGEKGLGGKQVWLRDPKRGQSLYYAHLDSIVPLGNARVKKGDTIGFVGNTGNARTTAPHLHFGIYRSYRGAIDPLAFVFQLDEPGFEPTANVPKAMNLFTIAKANLRDKPNSKKSNVIGKVPAQDTLRFLGKSADWYHVRTSGNQAAFVHESLVAPLKTTSPD